MKAHLPLLVPAKAYVLSAMLLRTLVAAIVTLAVVGAALAAGLFVGSRIVRSGLPATVYAVGQEVPTSFGALTIEEVEHPSGPAVAQEWELPHGQVRAGQTQVKATVLLTNTRDHSVDYSNFQFRLLSEKTTVALPPSWATLDEGVLPSGGSIAVVLSFIVPADAGNLWLQFSDPLRPSSVVLVKLPAAEHEAVQQGSGAS